MCWIIKQYSSSTSLKINLAEMPVDMRMAPKEGPLVVHSKLCLVQMISKRFAYSIALTVLMAISIQGQETKKTTYFNQGITVKPFSIRVDSGTKARYILINNPHINGIEGFRNGENYLRAGDRLPFFKREYPLRYFIFSLDKTEITSNNYVFVLQKKAENLSGKIELLSIQELQEKINYENVLLGGILGSVFVIIAIAFILILVSREGNAFFFLLYTLSSVAWMLNDAGYFYQFLWPDSPNFHQLSRTVFSTTSLSCYVFMIFRSYKPQITSSIKIFLSGFLGFIAIRILLLVVRTKWQLNEDIQLKLLYGNAIVLLILLFSLFYLLYFKVFDTITNVFEKFGLLIYWLLIVSLSLHQLGIDIFGRYQYGSELYFTFFILQIMSIALGLIVAYHSKRIMLEKEKQTILLNQQKIINENVISAQVIERNRIGRSLHDEVGSLLSSIKLMISKASKNIADPRTQTDLSDASYLVSKTIEKNHQIVHDLAVPDFKGTPLKQIILQRIKFFSTDPSIRFDVEIDDINDLPERSVSIIYRIIIELINNTVKHAQASKINCVLKESTTDMVLEYSDNGRGFDVQETMRIGGLRSFLYNAQSLDAVYTIKSDENGTYYSVTIRK